MANELEFPSGPPGPGGAPIGPDGLIDPSFAEKVSIDRKAWFDIWSEDRLFRISSHRRLAGRFVVLARRLLRPIARFAAADILQRQRLFNLSLLYLLDDLYTRMVLREDLESRAEDLRNELRKIAADIVDRDETVFSVLDRKADLVEESIRRLEEQVVARDAVISGRLDKLKAGGRTDRGRAAGAPGRGASGVTAGPDSDADAARLANRLGYLRFEDQHRGSESDIAGRQASYVKCFEGLRNVVDVGCGRGEFLEQLAGAGIEAYGVDLSEDMVSRCKAKGLAAVCADAALHLQGLEDASLGGIFAAHVIEHMHLSELVRLLELAAAKIRPGGRMVLETPNPEALEMGASSFYRDPTHVRPLHPDGVTFLLQSCGFRDIEVRRLRYPQVRDRVIGPRFRADLKANEQILFEDVKRIVGELNELISGSLDYAVIAVR